MEVAFVQATKITNLFSRETRVYPAVIIQEPWACGGGTCGTFGIPPPAGTPTPTLLPPPPHLHPHQASYALWEVKGQVNAWQQSEIGHKHILKY